MSRLSLGLAVERLPTSSIPVADPPDLVGFDAQQELRNNINRVLGRFHSEGKWSGLITQAVINAYGPTGKKQITLPRHLEGCIRGGRKGFMTVATQSQWYQYLPGGAGIRHADIAYYGPLQDLGQGYTTFRDIEEPGELLIETTDVEDNYSYLNLRCLDANGKKVWTTFNGEKVEGYMIDLSTTPVTITGPISAIYGATKPITSGFVKVSYGSDTTLIAEYEPGERVASYRRYLVSDGQDYVQGIFKRQHVWAYSDNDPMYPDNLEALKLGLLALNNEEKSDVERAQFYMDKAIMLLNNDLKEHFSGLEGTAQISSWLTGGITRVN
jgi:hypothetical protein